MHILRCTPLTMSLTSELHVVTETSSADKCLPPFVQGALWDSLSLPFFLIYRSNENFHVESDVVQGNGTIIENTHFW